MPWAVTLPLFTRNASSESAQRKHWAPEGLGDLDNSVLPRIIGTVLCFFSATTRDFPSCCALHPGVQKGASRQRLPALEKTL